MLRSDSKFSKSYALVRSKRKAATQHKQAAATVSSGRLQAWSSALSTRERERDMGRVQSIVRTTCVAQERIQGGGGLQGLWPPSPSSRRNLRCGKLHTQSNCPGVGSRRRRSAASARATPKHVNMLTLNTRQ